MTDDVWKREEVESPCVKVCVIHEESGLCLGCYRSLEEIAAWSSLPPQQRQAIMNELPSRTERVKPRRRGGRGARSR
ncbi:DUF1289 domain-containing protein [Amaricoccus macauensis]|uniref:DUF1289 domain-containing protein n=1 Tax=Amaricoccus macauensis TaxID=57001 RepID=UPI003C7EBCFF